MNSHERNQLFDLMLAIMSNSKTINTGLQDLLGWTMQHTEPEVVEIIATLARANNEIHRLCKNVTTGLTQEEVEARVNKIIGDEKNPG
ncbi:MAG: hypothetical protein KDJ97_27610 [Anaerolineae bacterium]|nr:hypothetical protein [Anaerolineae bacterium]